MEALEESAEKDDVVGAQEEVLEEAWGVLELVQQLWLGFESGMRSSVRRGVCPGTSLSMEGGVGTGWVEIQEDVWVVELRWKYPPWSW